jgi:hypothetical protein
MADSLPKNTWIDQVINIGLDKNIPFGVVNTVVDKSTGKMIGFIRDGKFYELGATPTKELVKKSTAAGFNIDELNKELPNGGINIAQVNDYVNSDDPKLADAARKTIALQSLGIWDMNGKPTTKGSETNEFGKISVTDADIKAALDKANEAKQKATTEDFNKKKAANDTAQSAGRALPYPNLSTTVPTAKPIESVEGFKPTPVTPTGTVETANVREGRIGAPSTSVVGQTPAAGTLVTNKVNPAGTKGASTPTGQTPKSGLKSKGTATDKAAATATADAAQIADFQARYGVQAALVNSDPSLKALFDRARKENWLEPRFKAELLNTDWAKNHAETWQASERARLEGPDTHSLTIIYALLLLRLQLHKVLLYHQIN